MCLLFGAATALAEQGWSNSAAQFVGALGYAQIVARGVLAWWQDYDLLLTPTLATPPPKVGERVIAFREEAAFFEHRARELRVRLPRPVAPTPRDEHILSAYGDALAVALHNAAARRRIPAQTVTASAADASADKPCLEAPAQNH